jgi:type I restriction enzyme R subunit
MHEYEFRSLFNATLFGELNLIRKTGNIAAHGKKVSQQDALASLKYLFRFLRHLAIYYGKKTPETQAFDESLIPQVGSQTAQAKTQDTKQLEKLLANLEHKNSQSRKAEKTIID